MEKQVEDICREGYWDPLGELPDRVRMKVFDSSVTLEAARTGKLLQQALNALGVRLKVDGKICPATRGGAGWLPPGERSVRAVPGPGGLLP